ncbi:hypothetical protein MOQ_009982 [Trypanosoma cruzi marinkellei]|uniref:Uncharacterized protein n=1 Tax=Trypanosoma cruzi marinkellei TaxID=85056 RepID=K2MKU1_TRYCR|nr:hypothetical protein MOQ_009982 [Trypanosoma cruzi marinkellei]
MLGLCRSLSPPSLLLPLDPVTQRRLCVRGAFTAATRECIEIYICVWAVCVLLVLPEPSNFTVAITVCLSSFLACMCLCVCKKWEESQRADKTSRQEKQCAPSAAAAGHAHTSPHSHTEARKRVQVRAKNTATVIARGGHRGTGRHAPTHRATHAPSRKKGRGKKKNSPECRQHLHARQASCSRINRPPAGCGRRPAHIHPMTPWTPTAGRHAAGSPRQHGDHGTQTHSRPAAKSLL